MTDATIVQNDSARALIALLSDRDGPLDLSLPSVITIHIRQPGTPEVVSAPCDVVTWPELIDGQTVQAASYDWAAGGNELAGMIDVEWELTYGNGALTVPTRAPLRIAVRPGLA